MKPMDLWESFGGLDADLIERSQNARKIIPWKAITAACVALAVLSVPVLYLTLFTAGKSALSEDAKEFVTNQESFYGAAAETAEPEDWGGDAPGLVINNLDQCQVPFFEYEPLPDELTFQPIPAQELPDLLPGIAPQKGEWVVNERGEILRTKLWISAETAPGTIQLSMAQNLYASDCPPAFRPDTPGDAELSRVGNTDVLVLGIPTRSPGGTGWKLTVLFTKENDYELTATATPKNLDAILSTIQSIIQSAP